jgi:general secretion pathway protein F
MPLFQYTYLNHKSKRKKGYTFGNSAEQAKQKLFEDKVPIISLKLLKQGLDKNHFNATSHFHFFSQLERLISSSIPLHDAISLLSSQLSNSRSYHIISSVEKMVGSGHSFFFALSQFPKSFPDYITALIKSGETSGDLSKSLKELCKLLCSRIDMRQKILSSVSYPLFLLFFGFCILLTILLFVIPSIKELFISSPPEGITKIVFKSSYLLQSYWEYFLLSFATLVASFFFLLSNKKRKESLQKLVEKAPLVHSFIFDFSFLSYFQILSILFESSVPLIESLEISQSAIKSPHLKLSLMRLQKNIEKGSSLSLSMKDIPSIPPIVQQLIELGEVSGNYLSSFNAARNHFEQRVRNRMEIVQKYAQPILLLLIGTVIGGLMLSILMPLTDMSNLQI